MPWRPSRPHRVRLVPNPGDILFINNYALLHAREGCVGSETDPTKRRYMMRLWLHDTEKGWVSAAGLKRDMSDNFDLPPERQALMTGSEWDNLPRSWRVKSFGVSSTTSHDQYTCLLVNGLFLFLSGLGVDSN